MKYRLKRSKRKSIGIYITEQAEVEVRAPLRCPASVIDAFVDSRKEWISEHLEAASQRLENKKSFVIHTGIFILFCGRQYRIARGEKYELGDGVLFVPDDIPEEQLKAELIDWYRCKAKEFLCQRVAWFSSITGWRASAVKLSNAATRWGSCSAKNSLNFSWKLVMAQQEAFDYVVVHELAHTVEHNHSVRFWKLVESVLPDYRERQKQLRRLEKILLEQDWEK